MKEKKSAKKSTLRAAETRSQKVNNRRFSPVFEISPATRNERSVFLIVCEGKNTEPDYFEEFIQYHRITSARIVTIGGVGDPTRVVERAQKESEKARFDQIWVIFDKDDFPPGNFDNAIRKAEAAGFSCAYSNQAFEYWLILHFESHQGGAMHRNQYAEKINRYLAPWKIVYEAKGNKRISTAFFEILMETDEKHGESRLEMAIKRAEKILDFHAAGIAPSSAESSTTVHTLVLELLKFV